MGDGYNSSPNEGIMIRRPVLVPVLVAIAVALSAAKQERPSSFEGAITGVVLTEDGRPASDFKVCLQTHLKQQGMEHVVTNCRVTTNSAGQFTIEHLTSGVYAVLATNDEEGYSIENQSPGQSVTVSQEDPHPSITMQLHGKEAVIVARITDKNTGKPLHNANLGYTGIDCEAGGAVLRDVEGRYFLVIPTNCSVVVIARAKGYRGWVYTNSADPSAPFVRLQAGEHKVFDIQLEPIPEASTRP
jgi:hypothetical protein